MVATQLEALVQVEPVRILPLVSRIEMQLLAAVLARLGDQPVHEGAAVTGLTTLGRGDQIIDVQHASPRQEFEEAIPGGRDDRIVLGRIHQGVASRLLPSDPGDKHGFDQMGTKHLEYGEAGRNLTVGGGRSDFHGGRTSGMKEDRRRTRGLSGAMESSDEAGGTVQRGDLGLRWGTNGIEG